MVIIQTPLIFLSLEYRETQRFFYFTLLGTVCRFFKNSPDFKVHTAIKKHFSDSLN